MPISPLLNLTWDENNLPKLTLSWKAQNPGVGLQVDEFCSAMLRMLCWRIWPRNAMLENVAETSLTTTNLMEVGMLAETSLTLEETTLMEDLLEKVLETTTTRVVAMEFKYILSLLIDAWMQEIEEIQVIGSWSPDLPSAPTYAAFESYAVNQLICPVSKPPPKPKQYRCFFPECLTLGKGQAAYLHNLVKHYTKFHLEFFNSPLKNSTYPCKANEAKYLIQEEEGEVPLDISEEEEEEEEEDFSTFQSVEITPLAKDLLEVNEEVDLSAEKEELMFSMELDENQEEEAMSSSLQCKLESCIENLDEGPVLYSPIELNPTPFFPPTSPASSPPASSPPATTPPASSTPMVSRSPSPSPSSGTEVEDRVETMPWEPRVFPLSEEEAREIEVVFT